MTFSSLVTSTWQFLFENELIYLQKVSVLCCLFLSWFSAYVFLYRGMQSTPWEQGITSDFE